MEKKLQRGRIVWTEVIDPQGNSCGPHGAIILTPECDIESTDPVRAVVISSADYLSPPEERVDLPWNRRPGGHGRTELKKKCSAVCTWLVAVKKSDILDLGGTVPEKQLLAIVKKVAELDR